MRYPSAPCTPVKPKIPLAVPAAIAIMVRPLVTDLEKERERERQRQRQRETEREKPKSQLLLFRCSMLIKIKKKEGSTYKKFCFKLSGLKSSFSIFPSPFFLDTSTPCRLISPSLASAPLLFLLLPLLLLLSLFLSFSIFSGLIRF